MVIIPHRKGRSFVTFDNLTEVYRFDPTILVQRSGTEVFFNGIYKNPFLIYQFTTKPLETGTYKVKIVSEDDLQNVNVGVQGTASVVTLPLPPRNLTVSVSGNNVTLNWDDPTSGSPDNYKIYGNGGSGKFIDRDTVLSILSGTLKTDTFAVADGDWRFVVESVVSGVESINLYLAKTQVPDTAIVPPSPGIGGIFAVTNLTLRRISVGKVKIRFEWNFGDQADDFNVYHDGGTGTLNFTTPDFTFSRVPTRIQEFTTTQLHTVDENITFQFVVRSVNTLGNEDGNTSIYTIDVDGEAPDVVEITSTGSVL